MCSEYSGPWGWVWCPLSSSRLPCPLTAVERLVQPVRRHLGAVCVAWPVPCDWMPPALPFGPRCRKLAQKAALVELFLLWITSFTHCCDRYALTCGNPWERGQFFLNSWISSILVLCSERPYTHICSSFILYVKHLSSVMWQVLFF